MRILHTSDWHVGRTLNRVSRIEETRAALVEIAGIAEREEVDGVVVTGDVFEHQSPSAEAEQVVYEALERFCTLGISVVIITGNHDHPGRWNALAPLLRRFNVHVVDDLRPSDQGGMVELNSRDGKQELQIACVPWVSERRSYTAADLMGASEQTYKSYADATKNAIEQLCAGFTPGKCHLLAGHLFISGSIVSESERALTIGEIYAVTPNAIPATVQYAALGHVHKPQKPPGVQAPCRYSGSLIQLDFGEAGQAKKVFIVDLEPDKPAKVRELPLTLTRSLKDVSGTLEYIETYENDPDGSYLRVTLECDGPQPGLSDQVREILPNALVVKLLYPDENPVASVDFRTKSPRELFQGYYSGRYGADPTVELLDAFDELLSEVSGDDTGQLTLGLEPEADSQIARAEAPEAAPQPVAELPVARA